MGKLLHTSNTCGQAKWSSESHDQDLGRIKCGIKATAKGPRKRVSCVTVTGVTRLEELFDFTIILFSCFVHRSTMVKRMLDSLSPPSLPATSSPIAPLMFSDHRLGKGRYKPLLDRPTSSEGGSYTLHSYVEYVRRHVQSLAHTDMHPHTHVPTHTHQPQQTRLKSDMNITKQRK